MQDVSKVVIVGAGPTGLSAAILLRLRGYQPIVLDKRPSLAGYPAAHVANTRTMEVLAEMGVAERAWVEGDKSAMSSLVVWAESMAGREYGVLPIQGAAHDERGPLSAYKSLNIPQTQLEMILFDRLIELGGAVRFGEEVIGAANVSGRVEIDIKSVADDSLSVLGCDWLLGCDGAGSAVRRSNNIVMEGPQSIARFMTIYFQADLDRYREGRRGLLYWIGGREVRGVFISFDEVGRTWAMLVPIGDLPLETFSDSAATAIIKKAIGDADAEVELRAVSSWNMSAQVAETYRRDRILLAGDACHRFPPTGGLGMNTGIQDAHNLVWKLCAVMEGGAADALIDTYEEERRPIARRNTDQSVENLMKMGMIDEALGILTLEPIAHNAGNGPIATWPSETLGIDGVGPEASARRAAVQLAVDEQAEHFAQGAGIDLGFSYLSGAFVDDGSPLPSSAPCNYRPDAHPGARLPFSSPDGSFERSTLGHVRPVGVTLFARNDRWHAIADAARVGINVPVSVVLFGADGIDLGPMASDFMSIEEDGAVAVRPDGHVLWRTRDRAQDVEGGFANALRLCAGLGLRSDFYEEVSLRHSLA